MLSNLRPTSDLGLVLSVDFCHNESRLIGVDSIKTTFQESGSILEAILPLIEDGTFPAPPSLMPVGSEKIIQAYRDLADGNHRGKVVFTP